MNQDAIPWIEDYERALRRARDEGRLLVVHFRVADRPLGKEMEEQTFADFAVRKASRERFINARIDIEAHADLFRRTIGGRGGLGTCILDGSGDAISILPGFAEPALYLAFLSRAETGYPLLKAARVTAEARRDGPNVYALAERYEGLESHHRAETLYEEVVRLGDSQKHAAFSHERLARIRVLKGRLLEVGAHVEACRKLDPADAFGTLDRILLTEGLAATMDMRYRDAIAILEDARRRFPAGSEADHLLFALGVARHEKGDHKPALADFELLIRTWPASPFAARAREQIDHIQNPRPGHPH